MAHRGREAFIVCRMTTEPDMGVALRILTLAMLCAGVAQGADAPPACQTRPFALQIDQVFEKRESYTVGGEEFIPFAGRRGGMRFITITQRTHGEKRVIVPVIQAGRSVRGTGAMTMEADDHIRARTRSCIHKRVFVVNWTLHGVVSEQCTFDFAGSYPPISETWQTSLKAEHGASTKRELGNFKSKDITVLTLISTAPPQ
jgi:hypothetical protein